MEVVGAFEPPIFSMGLEIKNFKDTEDIVRFANELGDDPPLRRILFSAQAAGCKALIIENNFEDKEYTKEFDTFYKDVFNSKPPKDGIRFHLFDVEIPDLQRTTLEKIQPNYMGYCSLRPLSNRRVCDAFITKKTILLDEDSKFVYLICEMTKCIELNGVKFEVKGFPYMQQDGRIAACAQTTISLISKYLKWKGISAKELTGPEVTEITSESWASSPTHPSRRIPTSGLNADQMFRALEELNCKPLLYDYTLKRELGKDFSLEHPEQVIYRYLESGLPVIIGITVAEGKHTILAIDHTFNPDFIEQAKMSYNKEGIIGIIKYYFKKNIVSPKLDVTLERKIVVLKKGYPSLPATKAEIIFKGFNIEVGQDEILAVYASYGMARCFKEFSITYDFMSIGFKPKQITYRITKLTNETIPCLFSNLRIKKSNPMTFSRHLFIFLNVFSSRFCVFIFCPLWYFKMKTLLYF